MTFVRLTHAWPTILNYAYQGNAPTVSHIGSSWVSPLAIHNALRLFNRRELIMMGGSHAFAEAAWRSATLDHAVQAWAIPWQTFTFVLVYRRDLLERAGVDETNAFETTEAMEATLRILHEDDSIIPWVYTTSSSWDLIHVAASWVWDAGGEFLSDDGRQILGDKEATYTGLGRYFRLYRYMPLAVHHFDPDQCFELFIKGKTAMTIVAANSVGQGILHNPSAVEEVREHLGVVALPGTPWVGGDNLVIWQNSMANLRQERAALALIKYLTDTPAQVQLRRTMGVLPARLSALEELNFEPPSLRTVLHHVFQKGRPHSLAHQWERIEQELRQVFHWIVQDVLANPGSDVETLIHKHLDPMVWRLEDLRG